MFLIHQKCSLCQKPPKNNARNDVLGKNLGKTTHETMFWKKTLEKQRTKRCFGKKLGKTTRETMFWKKALEKQRTKRCFGKKPPKNNARSGIPFLKPCRMCALEAFFYASPSSSPACLLFQSANSSINCCKPKAFILGW